MSEWILLLIVVGVSFFVTVMLLRFPVFSSMVDLPNERSSHTAPTPRSGGVAIVVSFLIGLPLLALIANIEWKPVVALFGATFCVALTGLWDDHGHIRVRWRLLAHFVAAGWALYWFQGMPPLVIFEMGIDLGWIGPFLAALYLVWMLNLYNFMDGIDGIAGVEAVTVCLSMAVIYFSVGYVTEILPLGLLIAAVAGFLVWNFPRARIFMGDTGSGFVGTALGVFSIWGAWLSAELFWSWLIVLGAFIVDATLTLIRRVVRGDKFYEAHRSHAYQYASRKYGSHIRVSLAFGGINLLWLLPLAFLTAAGWLDGLFTLIIAYLPLIWLAFHFKAGARELQEV